MASNRKPIKQLREAIQQSRDVLTVDSVSGQVYALDPPAELELAFRRGVERIARGLLYRARPDRPLYHHECRMQSLTVLPKDRLSNLQYLLSQIRWTTTTFPGNRICMDWAFATDVEPGSAVSWVQFHDSTDMLMWFLPPPPDEIIEGPKVPWERGAANLSGSL